MNLNGVKDIKQLPYGYHFTVSGLIEELKKCDPNAPVGHYHNNSANRGDGNHWISLIRGVEICRDGKTVALIGGFG